MDSGGGISGLISSARWRLAAGDLWHGGVVAEVTKRPRESTGEAPNRSPRAPASICAIRGSSGGLWQRRLQERRRLGSGSGQLDAPGHGRKRGRGWEEEELT